MFSTSGRRRRAVGLAAWVAVFAGGVVPAGAAAAGPGRQGIDPSLVRRDGDISTVVFDSGSYLTGPSPAPPAQIALKYIRDNQEDFRLSNKAVAALTVTGEVTTKHDGAHHVVIGQEIDGIPVDNATITALVDREGRLVLVGGRSAETNTSGAARLTAGQAIGISAQRAGAGTDRAPEGATTKGKGKHRFTNPYAKGLKDPSPVSAELVWHLRDDRSLRLAWETDVEVSSNAWLGAVVDAETGAVLASESRYDHSGPQGTVFREEHPEVTGATRQVTAFTGLDGSWVAGTTTNGNNVNAYLDRTDTDANDEYQPTAANQHFDYAFTDAWRTTANIDSAAALDADRDAIITQLFYYNNVIHDRLYGFGFDEASGNFQTDNFGRGGTAGDAVLAEAQDGYNFGCPDPDATPNESPDDRCRNNANFGTNGDGSAARMQMYMWVPGRPFRDGSMDGDVIAHEYGHGVSNRLVPNQLSNAVNQAGSLGEGWSDAVSFLLWGDANVGEYVTGNANGGIRTSSYDTHPDTYGDYNIAASIDSPHRNGEIWAATLYDVRELLGLDPTMQLVLDGMRSTANGPSPTFLNARDGILAADMTNNGGANQCSLWAAFAGRGMGTNAVSNGLHAVPTEDTTVPAACRPTADAGGPYITNEGTDVVLSGSASAPGTDPSAGALVSYEWDLDNDGAYDDATGVSPTFTTVGQDGVLTIGLRVTDEAGLTATDTSTVTVNNVAPIVSIDAIAPIDELGVATVTGTVRDPGWLDPLTATIDFDDGSGAVPLTGVVENVRPDATFTFNVDKQYGDNGTFTVTVRGFDDDTSSVDTENAGVANVNPTAAIDTAGEQVYDGVSAFILEAGGSVTVPAGATDPGSDDLLFTWDWDDGTTSSQMSLVNPPASDPAKSPSVQPRNVSLSEGHTYGEACLYDLTVTVDDDDGGSASDSAAVVVVGNADLSRGSGYWLNEMRVKKSNSFSPATIDCYLAIVNYFSLTFDGVDRPGAAKILHNPAKPAAQTEFDQQAMAAWLNFANGAVALDTMVDTTGDGVPDMTFGAAMLTAETVRTNPASTQAAIRAQKNIVERIALRDGV